MAELTAPQQNRLLAGLSNLLRRVEQDSGPEFLPRGLDVMGLVRQLALPSAETVEKMSYGDPLFRMPTQSNIPITTDRGYLAEVLGLAPAASAASRATTRLSNEAADALVRQITGNQQATAQGALQAAGEMAPLSRVIFPYDKEQIKKIDEAILSAKVPENIYFHGTDKDFKDFRRKDRGLAYYFTPDPMQAASYSGMDVGANIRPVKLDIKKTYRGGDIDEIMEVVKNEKDYYPYTISKMREFLETLDPKAFHTPSVIKALKKRGYDSFVEYENGVEQIGVFSNKNIKPAFEQQKTLDTLTTSGLLEPQAGARPMFETGREVTFPFIKNTEKAPKTTGFGQEIEPAGNYILSGEDVDVAKLPQGWTSGEVTFKNPLVLDWGKSGLYSEPDNWKQVLSNQYGGKTGKALSRAVAKDGYDGIVTINEYGPSEIVDLTMFAK